MGNTCSKKQQPDSVRVQKDNTSNEPSEVGEPCMLRVPGAPGDWKIYYRVLELDSRFMISISVKKHKFQDDVILICFFKMDKSPSKIEFNMSENESFSITAYIWEETSGEIVVHSITWESNEYTLCKEDGFFLECFKKIQRTDCEMLFVSELKPKSLSAQDAFTTGGGNASSGSEDVSPSNEPQTDGSEQVRFGQGVSTVSQTDESATLAPEFVSSDNGAEASSLKADVPQLSVDSQTDGSETPALEIFESDNGEEASALQTDVQRLSVNSQTDESATLAPEFVEGDDSVERLHQIWVEYNIPVELLEEPINKIPNVSGGGNSTTKDVNHHQEFARCGPPEESTTVDINTVTTFSGMQHSFTVSDDSKSMDYRLKNAGKYPLNPDFRVHFGIVNICSLKVYELSDGVYLIVIQTNSGQTYLSGYLSTNATPIFATFQITSNLEQKQFQSFKHVSGTVFKCFFSDGTEKTFSIESASYATIKEVLDT